jgi:hypothetical protein
VIPSFPWEVESSKFDDLVQDAHLHILSFLDVESIRHVMAVNHKYRQLSFSTDAHSVWMHHCQRQWNLPLDQATKFKLVDSLHLPTAAGDFQTHDANLPLLLSMTPTVLPTHVDGTLLGKQPRSWRKTHLESFVDEATGAPLVRYTGPVGAGDRCIRANQPFPRPQRRFLWKALPYGAHPTLLDLLCRGAKAVSGKHMSDWRPFVAPYVDQDRSIQVTPRMVAYYEVTIFPKDKNDDEEGAPLPSALRPSNTPTECVAVGVATDSFHVHTRMPGWDRQSFGYHGDDGGIFHSSGGMVERFGPCFGSGDTVGCGIDYVSQGIFFTLNGKLLGYGWKGIDAEFLQNNLYPVVGIDTNAAISVNFGAKPFQYDLSSFSKKHDALIASSYQLADPHHIERSSSPPPRFQRRRGIQILR